MNNTETIQALKDNLATLRNMDGGLRRAMESIEKKEFIFLLSDGTWDKANPKQGFEYEIYRLRPDYQEKAGIVEKRIYPNEREYYQNIRDKAMAEVTPNKIWQEAYLRLAIAADHLDAMIVRTQERGEEQL